MSKSRLVVSLTTIPSRLISSGLLEVLKSLHSQTKKPDAIYLGLPFTSIKLGKPYPPPPSEVRRYCKIVKVRTDYGPITKIMGAILYENNPDTIIITCDDDTIYPPTLLQDLYEKCVKYPKAAICSSGMIIGQFPGYFSLVYNQTGTNNLNPFLYWQLPLSNNPTPVDIVFGFSGVAYRREFFPTEISEVEKKLLNKVFENPDIFKNDDVLLSCYLNSQQIPRYA